MNPVSNWFKLACIIEQSKKRAFNFSYGPDHLIITDHVDFQQLLSYLKIQKAVNVLNYTNQLSVSWIYKQSTATIGL